MDWNVDPSQFEDDFETEPVVDAMKTLVETSEKVLNEMKTHLELGEKTQAKGRLEYLMNVLTRLVALSNLNDEELTEGDIERFLEEIEIHGKELDFNTLFNFDEDDNNKRGLDIADYLKEGNGSADDFDI